MPEQSEAVRNMKLFIGNQWVDAHSGETYPLVNPATGEIIGNAAKAGATDLADAVECAVAGFEVWREKSPYERAKILKKAADILRQRVQTVARHITLEQGKPLPEAAAETELAAETIEWFAEEGKRTYGRAVPARARGVQQLVMKEPIGPVALFTPWNFPLNQAARKIAAALASGCSVVAKPAEQAPSCVGELAMAMEEAGIPSGVLNLVYGEPSEISEFLIPHPSIRKISFTGSTLVGKRLAALAGEHMKRTTMELGGHAPTLVFEDAEVDAAATMLARAKFRNAGQVCVSPTRFLVHQSVSRRFAETFATVASGLKIGDGTEPATEMGPLANERRLQAVEALAEDAVAKGATLMAGGRRHGNAGYFYEPTVLADVPLEARAMNEEPFGPIALIRAFETTDEALAEANRLSYGLAAFAFTRSSDTVFRVSERLQAGMISINANLIPFPELPFGGIKDSGHGLEGGSEALDAYMNTKLVNLNPRG